MKTIKPTLAPGQILVDRYKIKSVLAKGGFSFIYLAERLDPNDVVVVKVLHNDAMQKDPAARERFKREAAIARQLEHPHHVRVHDYGATPRGLPFLILERLHGRELLELYEERAPLPVEDVRTILLQILDALRALHGIDIAHRDLKPANVFVCDTDDGSIEIKLLDYGLAKVLSGDTSIDMAKLTTKDIVVGTPGYLAPELLAGADVTTQVDLYAVGLIGYELFTGTRAYEGTLMDRAIAQSQRDPHTPPAERQASPLWPVIDRLIQREPADRYATADDAMAALVELDLSAPPAPVKQRSPVPRWVFIVAGGAVLLVILLIAVL